MTNTDKERADFEEWRTELLALIFHYANGAMLNGKTELKRHIARIERQIDAVPCAGREAERAEAVTDADYFASLVDRARAAAAKATVKFPQPNYVTLKIAEEAGEVVRGAVHYAEGRMPWDEVEGEIVQLLAMLIRFVTEGDQINGVTPPALSKPEGK